MKRGIPKLSPLYQTSQIEEFYSTVNHFAPKMVSFSYYGMYCRYVYDIILMLNNLFLWLFNGHKSMLFFFLLRLMVAALHFNENTSRVKAATKEGNIQYKISFPNFKHGEYSVRKKMVDSTYGNYNAPSLFWPH